MLVDCSENMTARGKSQTYRPVCCVIVSSAVMLFVWRAKHYSGMPPNRRDKGRRFERILLQNCSPRCVLCVFVCVCVPYRSADKYFVLACVVCCSPHSIRTHCGGKFKCDDTAECPTNNHSHERVSGSVSEFWQESRSRALLSLRSRSVGLCQESS